MFKKQTCHICKGTGKIEGKKCYRCNGKGYYFILPELEKEYDKKRKYN